MFKNLKICIFIFFILTVITGIVYPAIVTIIAQVAFPRLAAGSLVNIDNESRGSSLIGQKFTSQAYFIPRPSASDYGTLPAMASNLGPTSSDLRDKIEKRRESFVDYYTNEIPPEMLMASGSGLDPHISLENAFMQIEHIVKARGLSESERGSLEKLVGEQVENPQFGIFGSPRVNVLELNLALDKLFGAPLKNGEV